jgi:hypothetical protein
MRSNFQDPSGIRVCDPRCLKQRVFDGKGTEIGSLYLKYIKETISPKELPKNTCDSRYVAVAKVGRLIHNGARPLGDEYRQRKWKEICSFTASEIQMNRVSYHLNQTARHTYRTTSSASRRGERCYYLSLSVARGSSSKSKSLNELRTISFTSGEVTS